MMVLPNWRNGSLCFAVSSDTLGKLLARLVVRTQTPLSSYIDVQALTCTQPAGTLQKTPTISGSV